MDTMNVNRIGLEDSADNGPLSQLTREPNRELVQPNAAPGPPAAHYATVPVANLTAASAADSAAVAAPDPIDNLLSESLNALQLAPSPGTPAEAAPAHTQRECEAPARRGLHFPDDSDAPAVPSSKPEPLAVGLVDSEDDTTNPSPDRDREVAPRDRTLFDAVRADMGGFMSAAAQAGPTFGAVFPHILGIVQQAQAGQRATDSDKTALAALTKVLTTMSLKVEEVLQPGMSFKFVDGPGLYAYIIRSLNVTAFFQDAAQNTGWCVVKVGMTNKVLTERVKEEVNEISSKWRPGTAALQPRVNLNKPPACPPDPECDDSRDVVFTLQGFNFTGEERDCRNAMCDSGFHIGEAELDRENKPCIDTVDAISSKISPSNYPKKKQVCPRPFTEKYKLKSDLGWATWLMANGGKSTIGPSEFIVMPTPAVEKLQAKYAAGKVCSAADLRRNLESLDDAARPDAFGLNFVETTQSLGPLRFWSKSAKV